MDPPTRCPHWSSSKIQTELRLSSLEPEDLRRFYQRLKTRKFTSPIHDIANTLTIKDGWWLWPTGAGGKLLVLESLQENFIQRMDQRTETLLSRVLPRYFSLLYQKVLFLLQVVILSSACLRQRRTTSSVSAELTFKTSSTRKGRRSPTMRRLKQLTSQGWRQSTRLAMGNKKHLFHPIARPCDWFVSSETTLGRKRIKAPHIFLKTKQN